MDGSGTPDSTNRSDRAASGGPLSVEGLDHDLHGKSVRGGAIVMLGQGGSVLLGIASAAVLARLLDPSDFGLFAMASAFVALLNEFADLGLSQATIQRREVNTAQVERSLLGERGPRVDRNGDRPCRRLADRALLWRRAPRRHRRGVSIGFLFSGIAAQPLAVLRRRMRFTAETIITLGSIAIGLATAIVSAIAGLGYWSLVVQVLIAALVRSVGFFIASGWRPSAPARADGVREMLRFGGFLSGTTLLGAVMRACDKILIGRFVGADAAGLYSNAQRILLVPVSQLNMPLTKVGRPVLARLQHEPERFRAFYRRGIELVASTTFPAIAWMMLVADELVVFVLGREWSGSVPIFQALGPAALLAALGVITAWIYIPLGRTDRQFRWFLVQTPLVIAAMAIGVSWGAVGVAIAYSGTLLALRPFAIAWCLKGTFVRWSDVGTAVWRGIVSAAAASAACAAVLPVIAALPNAPLRLAASLAVFALAYVATWMILPGGAAQARAMIAMVRHLRPEPPQAGDAA